MFLVVLNAFGSTIQFYLVIRRHGGKDIIEGFNSFRHRSPIVVVSFTLKFISLYLNPLVFVQIGNRNWFLNFNLSTFPHYTV